MSDSAFVSHLVSQTRANVDFLQAQGYLTAEDAGSIQSKLTAATVKPSEKSPVLQAPTPQHYTPAPSYQLHPPNPPQPRKPTPSHPKARVLWPYNEDGKVRSPILPRSFSAWSLTLIPKEPNDLIMSAGDVIDIVEETNADWWTGSNRGKRGLFPSNYVEKLPPETPSQPHNEKANGALGYTDHSDHPSPQQTNPGDNVPPVNSVGLQPDEGQDKKKKKFGKFGGTVRSFPLPS